MDVVELIVLGVVVTILGTLTLAALSYGVFKLRERRSARGATGGAGPTPERPDEPLFERVRFPEDPGAPE